MSCPPLLKQPFCDYFGHDQYVLVKIVLSFQSRIELDNKLDHDAFKDLVAGGVPNKAGSNCSWSRG